MSRALLKKFLKLAKNVKFLFAKYGYVLYNLDIRPEGRNQSVRKNEKLNRIVSTCAPLAWYVN